MDDNISSLVEDIQELKDNIEDMISSSESLEEIIFDSINECLSDYEIILKDGTVLKPRKHMRVMSPDKSKVLNCYGGLRVDGSSLLIQTRISCWENIAYYRTREEAIEALKKVNQALKDNLSDFEL